MPVHRNIDAHEMSDSIHCMYKMSSRVKESFYNNTHFTNQADDFILSSTQLTFHASAMYIILWY